MNNFSFAPFDIRAVGRKVVEAMVKEHHGYGSTGASSTYAFAVFERNAPVACFSWQPPPYGAALAVCPECPQAVLSLTRMVAVPKTHRILKHISKPLKFQMKWMIDRSRYPVLVTYSDEGQGHNGFTYKCSGWSPTLRSRRPAHENELGKRVSTYNNGRHDTNGLTRVEDTYVQRWESRIAPVGGAEQWLRDRGWENRVVPGKTWRSGARARRWIRDL